MISHIQIGPVNYSVTEMRNDLMIGSSSDGSGRAVSLNADIRYDSLSIRVNQENAPAVKVVSLWHEAIHGILTQAGQDHSEAIVEALSYGLVALVKDNPELIKATCEGRL